MTFEYEFKAPNVIHLILGGVRREIKLEKLTCEMFLDDSPMAVEFKMSTHHKDIFIPRYPVVIYVDRMVAFGLRGVLAIMDMIVQEIVNILQIGQGRLESMTLSYDEHRVNYAMQPDTKVIRLPGHLGVFTKARVRVKFIPTQLDLNVYELTVQGQRRTYPEDVIFEYLYTDTLNTHPLQLGYSQTLVALGCRVN